MEVFEKFPLFSCWNTYKDWDGLLKIQNNFIRIHVHVPNYPSLKGLTLNGSLGTRNLLKEKRIRKQDIARIVEDSKDSLLSFLEGITRLLRDEKNGPVTNRADRLLSSKACELVLQELKLLEPEAVLSYSDDLSQISLTHDDFFGRTHSIKINIPPDYPHQKVEVIHTLPQREIEWPSQLVLIYKEFVRLVGRFELFWSEMDLLDENIASFDPMHPSRAACHRRILLEQNTILFIQVNPLEPKSFPVIHFNGTGDIVEFLNEDLGYKLTKWNPNSTVLENLQCVISSELPVKGSVTYSEESFMCIICYLYDFEGVCPEMACECGSFFHLRCLLELKNQQAEEGGGPDSDCDKLSCPCCSMEIRLKSAEL